MKYNSNICNFSKIPGYPFAYWMKNDVCDLFFKWKPLSVYTESAAGISSGNNEKYLKLWHEVDFSMISFNVIDDKEFRCSNKKYAPCNKGGNFRKWYGNNEFVALWSKSNEFHRNGSTYKELLFKEGMTWSAISFTAFNARYYENGFIFDHASPSLFAINEDELHYFIGLCNSSAVSFLLNILNPTINTGADTLRKIPVDPDKREEKNISMISKKCVEYSKEDWDNFEISWNFKKHPLI